MRSWYEENSVKVARKAEAYNLGRDHRDNQLAWYLREWNKHASVLFTRFHHRYRLQARHEFAVTARIFRVWRGIARISKATAVLQRASKRVTFRIFSSRQKHTLRLRLATTLLTQICYRPAYNVLTRHTSPEAKVFHMWRALTSCRIKGRTLRRKHQVRVCVCQCACACAWGVAGSRLIVLADTSTEGDDEGVAELHEASVTSAFSDVQSAESPCVLRVDRFGAFEVEA